MASVSLARLPVIAFLVTADARRARAFYEGLLGLSCLGEDQFAVVFAAHYGQLRVTIAASVQPAAYTVLGWSVGDIANTVDALTTAGVRFERYPDLKQDELGIWTSPGGAQVAWFKDPDGNLLSLTQAPAAA